METYEWFNTAKVQDESKGGRDTTSGSVMDGLVSHSVGDRDVIQIRKQSAAIGWEKQDEELSWGSHTRRNRLKRKGNKEAKSTELNLATDRWVAGTGEVRE